MKELKILELDNLLTPFSDKVRDVYIKQKVTLESGINFEYSLEDILVSLNKGVNFDQCFYNRDLYNRHKSIRSLIIEEARGKFLIFEDDLFEVSISIGNKELSKKVFKISTTHKRLFLEIYLDLIMHFRANVLPLFFGKFLRLTFRLITQSSLMSSRAACEIEDNIASTESYLGNKFREFMDSIRFSSGFINIINSEVKTILEVEDSIFSHAHKLPFKEVTQMIRLWNEIEWSRHHPQQLGLSYLYNNVNNYHKEFLTKLLISEELISLNKYKVIPKKELTFISKFFKTLSFLLKIGRG